MRYIFIVLSVLCAIVPSQAQKSIDVESVVLSTERVRTVCTTVSGSHPYCNDEGVRVQMTVVTSSPVEGAFKVHYSTEGGRTIGQGREVIWDLSNIAPGTYSITVG